MAVLGRGEGAESQLYTWLKWFVANGFVVECGVKDMQKKTLDVLDIVMNKHIFARMVKK